MIPHGRDVISEADIAAREQIPLTTWRRNHRDALRARLTQVNPGERTVLYDAAQYDAYRAGKQVPALPYDPQDPEPHPEDLLNDREAASVLGVEPSTVRFYAATGTLPAGRDVYGTRWSREAIDARRIQRDEKGEDWRSAEYAPRSRERRAHVDEVAGLLQAAARGEREPVTTAEVMKRLGVVRRTAAALVADAHAQLGRPVDGKELAGMLEAAVRGEPAPATDKEIARHYRITVRAAQIAARPVRVKVIAGLLQAAARGEREPVTTADVRKWFKVSELTSQRLLKQARESI